MSPPRTWRGPRPPLGVRTRRFRGDLARQAECALVRVDGGGADPASPTNARSLAAGSPPEHGRAAPPLGTHPVRRPRDGPPEPCTAFPGFDPGLPHPSGIGSGLRGSGRAAVCPCGIARTRSMETRGKPDGAQPPPCAPWRDPGERLPAAPAPVRFLRKTGAGGIRTAGLGVRPGSPDHPSPFAEPLRGGRTGRPVHPRLGVEA